MTPTTPQLPRGESSAGAGPLPAPEIIWGHPDGPQTIVRRAPIEIGIVRQTSGGLRYEVTGYVAVRSRPARAEEIERWRAGP